jgi:hypothetical protein
MLEAFTSTDTFQNGTYKSMLPRSFFFLIRKRTAELAPDLQRSNPEDESAAEESLADPDAANPDEGVGAEAAFVARLHQEMKRFWRGRLNHRVKAEVGVGGEVVVAAEAKVQGLSKRLTSL